MFRNIKKASEHSIMSERLIYKRVPAAGAESPDVLSPAAKAKKAREALMYDLNYFHGEKLIKLISEGAEYTMGDWRALNKRFASEFAKKGVGEDAAKRLLIHFQEQVFTSLKLKGDAMASFDGMLGIYTLYAFALYFNLKRPKKQLPYGNPKLESLINKDFDKAFKAYKEFTFAKNLDRSEFAEVYRDIKENVSRFNATNAKLGDWAIALSKTEHGGDKPKIGFPKIMHINNLRAIRSYPNVNRTDKVNKVIIELVIERDGVSPIFVDKNGKMYVLDKKKENLKPRSELHTEVDEMGIPKDWVPKPKKKVPPAKKAPAPQPEPKPKNEPKPKPQDKELPVAKKEPVDLTGPEYGVLDGRTGKWIVPKKVAKKPKPKPPAPPRVSGYSAGRIPPA